MKFVNSMVGRKIQGENVKNNIIAFLTYQIIKAGQGKTGTNIQQSQFTCRGDAMAI